MSSQNFTVEHGTKLVTRHPQQCANLFLKSIYPVLEPEPWFNKAWCLRFCAGFLQNIVDNSVAEEVDAYLLERIKRLPLNKAVRLLRKRPEESVKIMVVLISDQLNHEQQLSTAEKYDFYNTLFQGFFAENSDLKVSAPRPPATTTSGVRA